jgi:hypothetical protein
MRNLYKIGKNIYITSDDSKIEADDYYIYNNQVLISLNGERDKDDYKYCKKIILTDNLDLIKDGVQPVDYEFLEWFVKNQNCEEVEVKKEPNYNGKDEILWISNNLQCKQVESCYNSLSKKCICPSKMKQETLEEVAENFLLNDNSMSDNDRIAYVNGFLTCAKWQQEQNKKMYSEEDLRDCFYEAKTPSYQDFGEWFEQFKK